MYQTALHLECWIGRTQNKAAKVKHMQVNLTTEQKVLLALKPVTAGGKPATLDGKPTWSVDGDASILPADDGLSCEVIAGDDIGTATVTVSADADLGEGVVNIADSVDVTIVHAQASNLGLSVGTPETK